MKRIKDLPKLDRPREKLQAKGAQALSEFELLEVIIGSGNGLNTVEKLAAGVQDCMLRAGGDLTLHTLLNVKGLNVAKATQLVACYELTKRYVIQSDKPMILTEDYVRIFADISTKKQEYLVCVSLDGARRLIAKRVITVGLLDSVQVHPREVFADAIADRAAAIIIGHNHPSADHTPSRFDVGFNQQLIGASQIIGIELADHIIVGRRGYFSFKEEGLL